MSAAADQAPGYFERCYRQDDPFGYRSRWYEQRKRDLLLACLPLPRYASAWEPGCSNGEFTAVLAARCGRLLATDLSARAVDIARERTRQHPGVEVSRAELPGDGPGARFDLIVFGEIGYYLDHESLAATAQLLAASLNPGGLLLACHWLAPFEQASTPARTVHATLEAALARPCVLRYEDADFLLQGWSDAAMSVAQREGLR